MPALNRCKDQLIGSYCEKGNQLIKTAEKRQRQKCQFIKKNFRTLSTNIFGPLFIRKMIQKLFKTTIFVTFIS